MMAGGSLLLMVLLVSCEGQDEANFDSEAHCTFSTVTHTSKCPRGWIASDWGSWSECSRPCATGLKMRYRTYLKRGNGVSPGDSEASTCNTKPCSPAALQLHPHWHLPAPTAHGFYAAKYRPVGGFHKSEGEQAACVLDKTVALGEAMVNIVHCKKWTHVLGQPCYARVVEHLREHLEQCCEGREHFVVWKSNRECMGKIGDMLRDWRYKIATKMFLCQKHDKRACGAIKDGNIIAPTFFAGLKVARQLYAMAPEIDKTDAAAKDLYMCRHVNDCRSKLSKLAKNFNYAKQDWR